MKTRLGLLLLLVTGPGLYGTGLEWMTIVSVLLPMVLVLVLASLSEEGAPK